MDKLVVLAAGQGRRMQRRDESARLGQRQALAADAGVKALIPIERPFLDYVLTAVADAGYRQVCLVTGPAHDELRHHYAQLSGGRLLFDFVIQPEPLGTAHALLSAAQFAGDDPVAVINSDNYYPRSALESLRQLDGSGLVAFSIDSLVSRGNIRADRVAAFALVECDANSYLARVIEKPSTVQPGSPGISEFVSMNCWRFGPTIFEACRCIDRSPRKEYELADAVSYTMQHLEERYRVLISQEAVLDLSFRKDVLSVTERLRGMEVRL